MKRICPKVDIWYATYKKLRKFAEKNNCQPTSPPVALVLSGWDYSDDVDKMHRWEDTVRWATDNGCIDLISSIPEDQYYCVKKLTNDDMDWPLYGDWDLESKECPSHADLEKYMSKLSTQWSEIVGTDLASRTYPIVFTGVKARRLLVYADSVYDPPWGKWTRLSEKKSERRTFTKFRAAINQAIFPHEVDHIDFTHDQNAKF